MVLSLSRFALGESMVALLFMKSLHQALHISQESYII